METVIRTRSAEETKKTAFLLAQAITVSRNLGPIVIGLFGNLGAGKTTFVQGFARGLGVHESVRSPTFVLMKTYFLPKLRITNYKLRILVHIDCCRLEKPAQLLHLGLQEILADQASLVVIEWADRVKKLIPPAAIWIRFEHGTRPNERRLTLENVEIKNQDRSS